MIANAATESTIIGNLLYANELGIDIGGRTEENTVAHNDFINNKTHALHVPASVAATSFRNNIVVGHGDWAVHARSQNFAFLDFNLFFENPTGLCRFCSGSV